MKDFVEDKERLQEIYERYRGADQAQIRGKDRL